MSKKKTTQNSDYSDVNPGDLGEAMKAVGSGVKTAGNIMGQSIEGGKIIANRFNTLIHGKSAAEKQQDELQRLTAEVTALEKQKAIEMQLEELRKKKAALSGFSESEKEDENVAFA